MKLILLSKPKLSNLSFPISTFICAILFLFYGSANAQIIETFTSPTANSLNAVVWSSGTYYPVNQYVYAVDMATVPSVNRLYKVLIAGTSTTMPTGTLLAELSLGASYAYMGLVASFSSTWTCPTGVTSIQVECWGAGGAGGSASTATAGTRSGGGGGAGSYVKKTIAVLPGTTYNVIVGQGGYKGRTEYTNGYYGNLGGRSEFSGEGIAALVASGGTGGTGAGSANLNTNPGGVLGGVYGFNVTGTMTTSYTSPSVVSLTGGVGSGAIAVSARLSSATTYIATTNQGTGYTSSPSVSVSPGAGQSFLAYANPNINSTGDGITTILGSNGSTSSASAGGAGGISPDALAGGEGGAGSSVGGYVGLPGTNVGAGGGGGFSFYGAVGTNASAAGGAGANGKIVITYSASLSTYTYTGSGDLHDISNWKDGSNNAPANFTADFQIFKINSNATTTAPWIVSGASSKVVVGDDTHSNFSLTIASGSGITAPMDVTNGNKVYVQDIYSVTSTATPPVISFYMNHPTFGTLGDTSEVHYQNSTANNALVKTAFTYGKLYIDGSGTGTVYFSGLTNPTNHIVKTLFEVAAGSKAYFSEISYYYMSLNSGASANIYGTLKSAKVAGFVSSNVGTAASAFGSLQFIGSEALTLGANSTIEYNRADSNTPQIVTPRTDYKNLILSGANNSKSFTGVTTVSGNLNLNITGVTGTTPNFIPVTSTLAADLTVNGVLNFTAGKMTTGINALTIGTSGSITGAGAGTGWVVGNLIKQTATDASPSFAYAIGDATNYTPISLTFTGNNTAASTGSITATTTAGDHPQLETSGLDSNITVNRTWNLLNNGISGFTNYTVNLNYSTAETDAAATPANFVIRKYEGTTWTSPSTLETPTDSSASASGITGFGDFAVGQIVPLSTSNFELENVKIFPNPATNNFVTISSAILEDINVAVFDVLGKQISSQKLQNNRIDVSGLKSGIYLLKISQNEKTTTEKLVIK